MGRGRVEMYEDVLPDGRCKYRLPYIDRGKNRTLSVIMEKRSPSNYKLALRMLQERLDKIIRPEMYKDITLKILANAYLAEYEDIWKPSTKQRNSFAISKCVEWLGADVYISDLTAPYVKDILKKEAPAAVTYNEYIKRFKAMLRWGFENDYIKENTLAEKLHSLPDQKKERISDKYLEKDELKLLLEEADNRQYKLLIRFLALSGLRIGEAIALRESDIDSEYIHINRTLATSIGAVNEPKTANSIRDVYLRPELLQCVIEIKSYMRVYKFEHGIRSELLFCGRDGMELHYDAFRKYLISLSERVLRRRITPHALRHTAVSLLAADGVPLDVISRQMGHGDSGITKEIYFHVTKTLKERDNAILRQANVL